MAMHCGANLRDSQNDVCSLDSQTVGTEGNLGRIGFHTSGEGPDFLFDDFIVQTIVPEPATMGLLLIGMTAVMSVRRYGRIM